MNTMRQTDSSIRRACGRTLLAAALTAAGLAQAANFYVDASAPAGGTGGQSAPFRTLGEAVFAANAIAAPVTHNIYIATGLYTDAAHSTLPGLESFATEANYTLVNPGGGSFKYHYFRGGYVGYNGGSPDWTEGTRVLRSTVIDLLGANARALSTTTDARNCMWFSGFVFRNGNPPSGDGGAIRNRGGYDSRLHVENCLFEDNTAPGLGGAVRGDQGESTAWRIKNCEFYRNTAAAGGALFYNRGFIELCTFGSNTATGGEGGGAVSGGHVVEMLNCTVTNNIATHSAGRGGGVSGYGNAISWTIRRSTFIDNEANEGSAVGGGGWDSGHFVVENCLIHKNTARHAQGAAVFATSNERRSITVRYSTIADNVGGGIHGNATLNVQNNIIANNGSIGIRWTGTTQPMTINFNNVYNHTGDYSGNAVAGANDISADPAFINAVGGNYRLPIGSPSLDAGTNLGITTDIIGTMRPTRNGWDQGCYEEIDVCRIQNLAPVTTSADAVLRGELVYDGGMAAHVYIFWGIDDGGTDIAAWGNTNTIGLLASPNEFSSSTGPLTTGQSYWFRCYVSNAYDEVWSDASWSFTAEDVHVWTGLAGDGMASTAGNWFNNNLPTVNGTVQLDSYQANMLWDVAAPHRVRKWVQTDQYSGTATIATGWSNGFDRLTIDTDLIIEGGKMSHLANPSSGEALYRLKLDVGGNVFIAVGKGIDVDGMGYFRGTGPGAGTSNNQGGTHGGEGHRAPATSLCYGSVWEPVTLGSGGGGTQGRAGGGAVYLEVAETATVNGAISANGQVSTSNDGHGGAGGSVFLRAGQVAGTGTLRANGSGTGHNASGGGGGRVAVIVTNDTSFGSLALTAFGLVAHADRNSAAGTVYRESTAHSPQQGLLTLDNNNIFTRRARTVIPAGHSLTQFSEIVLSRAAVLGFDGGAAFDFGNMPSLTFNGPTASFIAVRDLTGIAFPANFTLSGYTLRLDAPLTHTGNWTIAGDGVLSHSPFDGAVDVGLDLTLNGSLTVDGMIDVRRSGYPRGDDGSAYRGPGYSGSAGSHGGRGYGVGPGFCYGSMLNPEHLGSAAYYAPGGGRARLSVSGNTAVNGGILIGCFPIDSPNGSGGSLDLQTGTLSGSGRIDATGGRSVSPGPTHSERGGGGGRIRVKLTTSDSFGDVIIAANGGRGGAGDVNGTGGAGSVYLERASEAVGRGRIVIDNANTTPIRATDFPPTQLFTDDLGAATLVITNGAWLNLTTNVTIGNLYMAANATFTLNGYTCKVNSLQHPIDGTPTGPGEVRWRMGTLLLIR